MSGFFDMDNKFFTAMSKVADFCILTIVALICCIPIITIGASLTSLYYVTLKMVRNEESYIVRSFFKAFKQNFRQATIIHLIMLVIAGILGCDMYFSYQMDNAVGRVLRVSFMVIAIFYLVVLLYVYPILAKFYNSIKNTLRNALFMAILNLPYTVIMLLIAACPILIFFVKSAVIQSILFMLLVFFGLGTIAYYQSFFFVKIFDKYIPNEEEGTVSGQEEALEQENSLNQEEP